MMPLLGIGLILLLAAVFVARRPVPLLAAASVFIALAVRLVTPDLFLVAAAGLLPLLSGLVLREALTTLRVVAAPRRAERRAQERERRVAERARLRERRDRLAA
jgi:hypothetical protein